MANSNKTNVIKRQPKNLFQNPNMSANWFRPRMLNGFNSFNNNPTYNYIDPSERKRLAEYALSLYCTMPSLGSAINSKNSWAFGSGWKAFFKGTDKTWANNVSDWLNEIVFPNCNILGSNYNLNATLKAMGIAYDVSGEVLPTFVTDRANNPKIAIIPSGLIGQRDYNEIVDSGRYVGNRITDAVIINGDGTPVAYKILGQDFNGEEDYDLSAKAGTLMFDAEHLNQYRGLSIVARSIIPFMHLQDLEEYHLRLSLRESQLGVIASLDGGTGEQYVDSFGGVGQEENCGLVTGSYVPPGYMISQGGEMFIVNAQSGEKLESYKTDRPHANIQDFAYSIEEKAIDSSGWSLALISNTKLNSVAARQLEIKTRNTIQLRQEQFKRFVKAFIIFSIGKGIENGTINGTNSTDWRKWDITMPGKFTIDSYYADQSSRQSWKDGSETLQSITSDRGEDWIELREQREVENKDMIDRASNLVKYATTKGQSMSFERAMDTVEGKMTNAAPVQEQTIDATTTKQ